MSKKNKNKSLMTIWKRVPRRSLKRYYARQEPVLLTHKNENPNIDTSAGVSWDWGAGEHVCDTLPPSAKFLAPSGYICDRQMAVNRWRENQCSNDYAEPVFWVKDYDLMRRVHKHYE